MACAARAYWRSVLSRWVCTCPGVDWRRETYAGRWRCWGRMAVVIGVLLAGVYAPVPRREQAVDEPGCERNQALACGRADGRQSGRRGAAWRHDGLPVAQGWCPRALRLAYRQRRRTA